MGLSSAFLVLVSAQMRGKEFTPFQMQAVHDSYAVYFIRPQASTNLLKIDEHTLNFDRFTFFLVEASLL